MKVAIKVIQKKSLTSEDMGLIKREIEILKLCQHPGIITLYDTFENADYMYIVMELMRGGDLYSYLETHSFNLPEQRVRVIIHSLLTALYYLHSYGIIHRDIKLDNILMVDETDDSDPKIVDFGLSKLIGPHELCNDPYGTYGYVAPEILRHSPYDKSVDIFSLGVVTYILLSGMGPFEGPTEQEIMR